MRRRRTARRQSPLCVSTSCCAQAKILAHHVRGRVRNQRHQSDDHCQIHQQSHVAPQRCFPSQLPDSRNVTQSFDGNCGGECDTDRDSEQSQKLRCGRRQNVPHQHTHISQAFGSRRQHVRQSRTPRQKISRI